MIRWDKRDDGIVVLTLDDPEQTANTVNSRYLEAMQSTVERLEAERDGITGVVVTSAKDTFFAGADLRDIMSGDTGGEPVGALVFRISSQVKDQFRRLERLGRPVVAALNGSALGGGLEIGLACHHRIAVDRPDARFGLPEVTLGLLPGGGGVVRTVRMLGLQEALMSVLLQGQRMRPAKARDVGLIDELVSTVDELLPAAIAWIQANPRATVQPWDRSDAKRVIGRDLAEMLPAFPANLRKQTKGAHYPAAHAILCAAVEGASVDFDTALRIEGRWFASLVGTPIQRNMTQAFFFDLQHLNRGGSRPAGPRTTFRRVGVVGAGMMGYGIGKVCAKAGLEVVLVDVNAAAAERGQEYGASTSDSLEALAGCDVVIEAVFEDLALKRETFTRVAKIVGPDCLLASNTSSLPITSIAEAVPDPGDFLGLHFFSPVERMPLVEIVRGQLTSDATLAKAYDLVRTIEKTPIVVNDSRGFFTSRVFGTYVMEGMALLAEGVPAASVEHAAQQAGYPVGPLAVTDEVTLTLGLRLRDEARKAGAVVPTHPGEQVIERMVEEYGRTGKSSGAGFYDYPGDGSKALWPGLAEAFGATVPPPVSMRDMKERMLFAEALESVRCLDEGVLTGVPDANIGSIFGIGFPPWTGGVLQYIETYEGQGRAAFVARARELAERYGDRFTPPESLAA